MVKVLSVCILDQIVFITVGLATKNTNEGHETAHSGILYNTLSSCTSQSLSSSPGGVRHLQQSAALQ